MDNSNVLPVLLTAVIKNKQQEVMTRECYESLKSSRYALDIMVDTRVHINKLAEKWNDFFDWWRGGDYEYLVVVANDTFAHKDAIDNQIRYLELNPDVGVVSGKLERYISVFMQNINTDYAFDDTLTSNMDTPAFVIRKGVIEKVGRVDELFPLEFIERDYFRRCNLAGFKTVGLDQKLFYHPNESMTIGYDTTRFDKAFKNYVEKWGGDFSKETYTFPYNDPSLDFTYCKL